jgi:hypothetical protein
MNNSFPIELDGTRPEDGDTPTGWAAQLQPGPFEVYVVCAPGA